MNISNSGGFSNNHFHLQTDSDPEIELSSDSDDEVQLLQIHRGKHDFVVKENKPQQGMVTKVKRKHAMFPLSEKKVKVDDYGEIINPDDYRMDVDRERPDPIKKEVVFEEKEKPKEPPTKCITTTRQVRSGVL